MKRMEYLIVHAPFFFHPLQLCTQAVQDAESGVAGAHCACIVCEVGVLLHEVA